MKRLSIICFIVMVFTLVTAHAQQYEVVPSGTKAFTTHAFVAPGSIINLDIWLTGVGIPQNAGGVWIDFSSSTDKLSYVSAGIASSWDQGTIQFMSGIVMMAASSVDGVPPDGDGDLIIGWITFQNTGPGDATIAFTTIPSWPTWSPLNDEDVIPGSLIISQVCMTDADCDGVDNQSDNCLNTPNGPDFGTCTTGISYKVARPCLSDGDCGEGGFCSMNQEDSNQDGIGDACYLCESDFNCDGSVVADDVSAFLDYFGRSVFGTPCTNDQPCKGDFNCDGNVVADDVAKFLEDFGRNIFPGGNPCPACVEGNWCSY